jgi:hypothetical protein
MNKPLTVDDASMCFKCGSVQCAFCSDDVKSAVDLMMKKIKESEEIFLGDIVVFKHIIDECFPCFKDHLKKEKQ